MQQEEPEEEQRRRRQHGQDQPGPRPPQVGERAPSPIAAATATSSQPAPPSLPNRLKHEEPEQRRDEGSVHRRSSRLRDQRFEPDQDRRRDEQQHEREEHDIPAVEPRAAKNSPFLPSRSNNGWATAKAHRTSRWSAAMRRRTVQPRGRAR